MSAIKQYSTLGSGFKIAMRDLEIRGAGNLLGAEQSGHITAVGFDLYCQLLKQSVSSLKGEKVKPLIEVQIRLDFLALSPAEESPKSKAQLSTLNSQLSTLNSPRSSAYIPFNYISNSRQRIEVYRKVAQIDDLKGLQTLSNELRDRFGPVPPALELLLKVAEIKLLAAERAITSIEVKDDKLMLTRNNDLIMVGSKFPRLTKPDAPGRLKEIKKLLLSLLPLFP
jgi:transcription-repair coupling factor (superfamily II helicase)